MFRPPLHGETARDELITLRGAGSGREVKS